VREILCERIRLVHIGGAVDLGEAVAGVVGLHAAAIEDGVATQPERSRYKGRQRSKEASSPEFALFPSHEMNKPHQGAAQQLNGDHVKKHKCHHREKALIGL
jgi:hypothetical protein